MSTGTKDDEHDATEDQNDSIFDLPDLLNDPDIGTSIDLEDDLFQPLNSNEVDDLNFSVSGLIFGNINEEVKKPEASQQAQKVAEDQEGNSEEDQEDSSTSSGSAKEMRKSDAKRVKRKSKVKDTNKNEDDTDSSASSQSTKESRDTEVKIKKKTSKVEEKSDSSRSSNNSTEETRKPRGTLKKQRSKIKDKKEYDDDEASRSSMKSAKKKRSKWEAERRSMSSSLEASSWHSDKDSLSSLRRSEATRAESKGSASHKRKLNRHSSLPLNASSLRDSSDSRFSSADEVIDWMNEMFGGSFDETSKKRDDDDDNVDPNASANPTKEKRTSEKRQGGALKKQRSKIKDTNDLDDDVDSKSSAKPAKKKRSSDAKSGTKGLDSSKRKSGRRGSMPSSIDNSSWHGKGSKPSLRRSESTMSPSRGSTSKKQKFGRRSSLPLSMSNIDDSFTSTNDVIDWMNDMMDGSDEESGDDGDADDDDANAPISSTKEKRTSEKRQGGALKKQRSKIKDDNDFDDEVDSKSLAKRAKKKQSSETKSGTKGSGSSKRKSGRRGSMPSPIEASSWHGKGSKPSLRRSESTMSPSRGSTSKKQKFGRRSSLPLSMSNIDDSFTSTNDVIDWMNDMMDGSDEESGNNESSGDDDVDSGAAGSADKKKRKSGGQSKAKLKKQRSKDLDKMDHNVESDSKRDSSSNEKRPGGKLKTQRSKIKDTHDNDNGKASRSAKDKRKTQARSGGDSRKGKSGKASSVPSSTESSNLDDSNESLFSSTDEVIDWMNQVINEFDVSSTECEDNDSKADVKVELVEDGKTLDKTTLEKRDSSSRLVSEIQDDGSSSGEYTEVSVTEADDEHANPSEQNRTDEVIDWMNQVLEDADANFMEIIGSDSASESRVEVVQNGDVNDTISQEKVFAAKENSPREIDGDEDHQTNLESQDTDENEVKFTSPDKTIDWIDQMLDETDKNSAEKSVEIDAEENEAQFGIWEVLEDQNLHQEEPEASETGHKRDEATGTLPTKENDDDKSTSEPASMEESANGMNDNDSKSDGDVETPHDPGSLAPIGTNIEDRITPSFADTEETAKERQDSERFENNDSVTIPIELTSTGKTSSDGVDLDESTLDGPSNHDRTHTSPPVRFVSGTIGGKNDDEIDVESGLGTASISLSSDPKQKRPHCRQWWPLYLAVFATLTALAAGSFLYFFVFDGSHRTDQSHTASPVDSVQQPTQSPTMRSIAPAPTSPPIIPLSPTVPPVPTVDVLLELLTSVSHDNGLALQDTSSPQYAAMEWIRTPNNAGIYSDRRFLTRYALATLFFSFNGPEWKSSAGWLTNENECDWFSLTLNMTNVSRPVCDSEGDIIELHLGNNKLHGTLPDDVFLLSKLERLTLPGNAIIGHIPTLLSSMSQLVSIDLSGNRLTGLIPTNFTLLTQLTSINLSQNRLTGPIPTNLAPLTKLTLLDLSKNRLTGPIPTDLAPLTQLSSMALSKNRLTGPIPATLALLTQLKSMDVSENSLTGLIPTSLAVLTQLNQLHLNKNFLRSTVPSDLGDLTRLNELFLGSNLLTGRIPSQIGQLVELSALSLSDNFITGTIPTELENLRGLSRLFLDNLYLSPSLPPGLCELDFQDFWADCDELGGCICCTTCCIDGVACF